MKHNICRLRDVLEITQPKLQAMLGCSLSAIRSIETGRLKLSPAMAGKVEGMTGVSADWLLRNDLSEAPVSISGAPYTKAGFIRHKLRNTQVDPKIVPVYLMCLLGDASQILIKAAAEKELTSATWRLFDALGKVGSEFGLTSDTWPIDAETGLPAHRNTPHPEGATQFIADAAKRITKAAKSSKK